MPVPADTDRILDLLAREERSLLRAAGVTRMLDTGDATDQWVKPLVEHVFNAAVERGRLLYVQTDEVRRERNDLGDLDALGRVEISWRMPDGHDAVLSVAGGAVAMLVADGGAFEILVAGPEPRVVAREVERLGEALRADPVPREDVAMRFWNGERKRPRRRGPSTRPSGPTSSTTTPRQSGAPSRGSYGRVSPTAARCCSGTVLPAPASPPRSAPWPAPGGRGARPTASPTRSGCCSIPTTCCAS